MVTEGRVLKPEDRIYDLVEPLSEADGVSAAGGTSAGRIFDLVDVVDVVEKKPPKMALVDVGLREEIAKRAGEIAEKVAREMVPGIAERVIREEIEKLRKAL
ncbi:MAG: hypothetical protein FWE89_00050 [Syntrophaceae bacterium]|nr:hypothetical protein [Syntrophaceae bacterium]